MIQGMLSDINTYIYTLYVKRGKRRIDTSRNGIDEIYHNKNNRPVPPKTNIDDTKMPKVSSVLFAISFHCV